MNLVGTAPSIAYSPTDGFPLTVEGALDINETALPDYEVNNNLKEGNGTHQRTKR